MRFLLLRLVGCCFGKSGGCFSVWCGDVTQVPFQVAACHGSLLLSKWRAMVPRLVVGWLIWCSDCLVVGFGKICGCFSVRCRGAVVGVMVGCRFPNRFRSGVPWLVVVAFEVACHGADVGWLIWCFVWLVVAFGKVCGCFSVSCGGAVVGVVVGCCFSSGMRWCRGWLVDLVRHCYGFCFSVWLVIGFGKVRGGFSVWCRGWCRGSLLVCK